MGVVSFFLALIVAVTSLAGGSLLWPRFTSASRPQILQQVHDIVLKTPMGQTAAQTLGVSDETTTQPINVGQLASSAANGIRDAAAKRAQTIIMTQVTRELSGQYEKLPEDQKQVLQEI